MADHHTSPVPQHDSTSTAPTPRSFPLSTENGHPLEERLQTVIEQMSEGLVISDLEGKLLHWNPAALAMHGFANAEEWCRMLPQFAAIFELSTLDGKLIPFDQWPLPRIYRGEKFTNYVCRLRRIGTDWERVFQYNGAIVTESDGTRLAFLTIADVTARTRAEEEIRRLNEELEARVAMRTAELRAAYEEQEAFSYSVSHDLRAPLRAINGFAEALRNEFGAGMPAKALEFLEIIQQRTVRMSSLIDGLLEFSRLSRRPLRREQLDLRSLIEQVIAENRFIEEGRMVELTIDALPHCEADPKLMEHVWMNLLSNALKYTSKQPLAKIRIGHLETEHGAAFFISDNGAGFDMRFADKLFGVFQRLHGEDDFPGTGLGLALVQRIISRHGGKIWAKAAPGAGATFYFTLGNNGSAAHQT